MHGAPGAHREPVNWLNHRPSCCVPGFFAVETIPTFHSICRPLAPNSFGHFYPRNSPTTPTMDAATPPTNIHIALSYPHDPIAGEHFYEQIPQIGFYPLQVYLTTTRCWVTPVAFCGGDQP